MSNTIVVDGFTALDQKGMSGLASHFSYKLLADPDFGNSGCFNCFCLCGLLCYSAGPTCSDAFGCSLQVYGCFGPAVTIPFKRLYSERLRLPNLHLSLSF